MDVVEVCGRQSQEKAKANGRTIENQDNSSNDIQGSEEDNQQRLQHARDTTNQTF